MKLRSISEVSLIPVQDTDQKYNYDCGPAALRAIISYFGDETDQDELIDMCDTGKQKGTHPDDLVRCAEKLGFSAKKQMNMTLDQLLGHLSRRHPVICAIQAWGEEEDKKEEYRELKSGHYVVAIGYDSDKIYFEDPSMRGTRGELPHDEFMERWYDRESFQRHGSGYTPHLGIVVIGTPKNPNPQKKTKYIP